MRPTCAGSTPRSASGRARRTTTPTETFSPFDVVAVPFPFSERSATKRRPALVVSSERFNREHAHVIVAMITTARRTSWASDCEIHHLLFAGLKAPSVVRLKLFTLDRRLVVRRIGRLSDEDEERVRRALEDSLA